MCVCVCACVYMCVCSHLVGSIYHDLPFSGVIIGGMHCIQIVLIFTAEIVNV